MRAQPGYVALYFPEIDRGDVFCQEVQVPLLTHYVKKSKEDLSVKCMPALLPAYCHRCNSHISCLLLSPIILYYKYLGTVATVRWREVDIM